MDQKKKPGTLTSVPLVQVRKLSGEETAEIEAVLEAESSSRQLQAWVLGMLKPGVLAARVPAPAPPSLVEESVGFQRCLDFSVRIHAALPFLAICSRQAWFSSLPEAVRLKAEQELSRGRMGLALLHDELERAVDRLNGARIPVMVLKGMDLSRRAYPDPVFRPMADVDLLVEPSRFLEAMRVLGRCGYRVLGPFPEGRIRVELCRGRGLPILELHRALLAGDEEQELAGFWDRSRTCAVPGLPRDCRILAAEDNLPYLLRHGGVQHLLESPVWLTDVSQLLAVEPLSEAQWSRACSALEGKRAAGAGWFLLRMLAEHWEGRVPEGVLERLRRRVGPFRRRALDGIRKPEDWFTWQPRSRSFLLRTRYLMRENAWEALKYGFSRRAPVAETPLTAQHQSEEQLEEPSP